MPLHSSTAGPRLHLRNGAESHAICKVVLTTCGSRGSFCPPMLNPGSPLPLYQQLAELLSREIASGSLEPGARLPSELELARRHDIGRPTVRQATELLVQRGLAERRRGSGTFVRQAPRRVDLFS